MFNSSYFLLFLRRRVCGPCCLWSPKHTSHTISTPRQLPDGLDPILAVVSGLQPGFFAFAWSHFELPPSDFLATIRWPLQPSSWHLSATNLNLAAERRVLKEPEGNSRWPWGMYTQFLQYELIIASELCIWTDLSVWERLFFPSALPPFVVLYHLHTIFTAGWLSAGIQIRAGYRRWYQCSSIDNPANACAEARLSRSACFLACLRVNSSSDGPVLRSCVNLHCSHAATCHVSEVCVRTHPCEGEWMCRVLLPVSPHSRLSHTLFIQQGRATYQRNHGEAGNIW